MRQSRAMSASANAVVSGVRSKTHILELAKRGAEHRYQELKAEIESLAKLFPISGAARQVRCQRPSRPSSVPSVAAVAAR